MVLILAELEAGAPDLISFLQVEIKNSLASNNQSDHKGKIPKEEIQRIGAIKKILSAIGSILAPIGFVLPDILAKIPSSKSVKAPIKITIQASLIFPLDSNNIKGIPRINRIRVSALAVCL